MKQVLTFLFALLTLAACSQTTNRIKLTQLERAPEIDGSRAGMIGLSNTNGDQRYAFYVNVADTCIDYTPTATGNAVVSIFVQKCATDSIWYIDWEGRSILLAPFGGGGSDTCDVDWLRIVDNDCPGSLTDSIYKYKYISVGARYVWPGAEMMVNDSVTPALVIIQGSRNARLAVRDGLNDTWSMLDMGGNAPFLYFQPTSDFVFATHTAGSTPQTPIVETYHLGIDDTDSTIQIHRYPNTRRDTQTVSNFLYTDDLGKIRSQDINYLFDSLGVVVYNLNTPGTDTIDVPDNAKSMYVVLVGAGGAGGSGRKGAAGTNRGGGAGGASGNVTFGYYALDQFTDASKIIVQVGAGGTGGASVNTNDTNGNAGSAGGITQVSTIDNFLITRASGGGGGGGGTTGTATAPSVGSYGLFFGVASSNANPSTSSDNPTSGSGAYGGNVNTSNVAVSGSTGGAGYYRIAAGATGGSPGISGSDSFTGNEGRYGTNGAGGGGASTTGNAGNGGAGNLGAGGGGGGGAVNSVGNSGAGGNGGNGLAVIYFYGGSLSGGGGSGTVTSVGLSLPAIFSVSGSPITTSGTLIGSLATQTANTVFAGPTSGVAAAPTFRALVAADIPSSAAGDFFKDGGNSFAGAATLGTNDDNSLSFETNNVTRATISSGASTGGAWTVTDVTANTNTSTENVFTLQCNSTGTPATNFGSTMLFKLKSSTTDNRDAAYIRPLWASATDGSRTSVLTFGVVNGAAAISECLRLNQNSLTVGGGSTAYSNSALTIGTTYTVGNSVQPLTIGGSSGFVTIQTNVGSTGGITINNNNSAGSIKLGDAGYSSTTMNKQNVTLSDSYTASSGTGSYTSFVVSPTFNLTGTASGTQYGIHVIPNFTSLVSTSRYIGLDLDFNLSNTFGIRQPGTNSVNYFAGNTGFLDSIPESLVDVAGLTKTQHLSGQDLTPVIQIESAAGTGASASLTSAQSSDIAGRFSITTGTGATTGLWLTVTFDDAYAVTPIVQIGAEDPDAANLATYTNVSTTGFELFVAGGHLDSTVFDLNYHVIGGK